MKPKRIIYFFGSLSDCIHIKNTLSSTTNDFILSLHYSQRETSIKQIRKVQLKSCFKHGDYLVLIDNPPKLIFTDDYTSRNILHFSNIKLFYEWFSSLERGG